LKSGVVTFKNHPQAVLKEDVNLVWLDSLKNRIELIKRLGIDYVIAISFTHKISKLTATEFMALLKRHLRMKGLVVGPDFALGNNREGTPEVLRSLGSDMDFSVEVMSPLIMNTEIVSSSLIRQALADGEIEKVTRMLGRPFAFTGTVVTGDRRGRQIGFKTANLEIRHDQAAPVNGVYATISHFNRASLPSVTNIGLRPTFGGAQRLIETHILDYNGELAGVELKIDFVARIRDEIRFQSETELIAQIKKDIEQVRRIFANADTSKESVSK
jgi:riboflavin kinase/FMN adenylyltransferase